MSCLQRGDRPGFTRALRDSRLQTMSQLQTMGLSCRNESYGRAYPSLLQLHILREAEEGFLLLHPAGVTTSAGGGGGGGMEVEVEGVLIPGPMGGRGGKGQHCRRDGADNHGADAGLSWSWGHRLDLLSPSLRHRDNVLALRRGLFSLCGMDAEVAGNWLAVSDMRRRKGDLHGARAALKNAEESGLDAEQVLIKECHLVKESGNISGAIALLEPLELDVSASRSKFRRADAALRQVQQSRESLVEQHMNADQLKAMAHRLFLSAQWLSLSHVKHGKVIIDRYKLALDLHKDWEAAHFELAKYFEVVAENRKEDLCKKGTTLEANQALAGDDIFLTNSVVSDL